MIDRWGSSPQFATLAVAQREGAITGTFGEIANHADMVLLIGRDPAVGQPRFFERLLRNRGALYRDGPPHVAYLGPARRRPPTAP